MNSTFSEEQPRATLETIDGTPRETEQDVETENTSFEEEDEESFDDDELDEEIDEDLDDAEAA